MPLKRNEQLQVIGLDTGRVEGSFITFIRYPHLETGVTQVWYIVNGRDVIAEVRWFTNWRKYAFYPGAETVYEEVCLREIVEFNEELTKTHRADRKQLKQESLSAPRPARAPRKSSKRRVA